MKAVKYLLYAVVGVVLLAVIALAVAVAVVDGAFVKERATREMKEKYQRTLSIEGTPRLSLFPVLSLELGKTRLSEHGSDREFLSLESARVAVKVMPLLSERAELESLALTGLKLNLVRGKDGRMNTDDLAAGGRKQDSHPEAKPSAMQVRIAGIAIERAQVAYRDEASGQALTIADLNLKAGALAEATPAPVAFSAQLKGQKPMLDVKLNLAGQVRVDIPRQAIEVAGLAFEAKGMVERDTLAAGLSAPKVSVNKDKASGSAVAGTLVMKGPGRNVNARLDLSAVEGSAAALSIPSMRLELDAQSEGNGVKGKVETPLKASLANKTWELPKVVANLTFSGPMVPQKSVTLPIEASLKADLGKQSGAAELSTKFDESSIRAKFGAARLAPLNASFDINVDRINLDRYIAAKPAAAKSSAPIDFSALKGPTVTGQFQVGALQAKGLKTENVKGEVKLAGGRLELSPYSANLYGGSTKGSLSLDANGNRVTARHAMSGVNLGPLLRDYTGKDMLDGKGNLDIDLATAGTTEAAFRKALAGTVKLDLKDGAIKGINLAESLRGVKAALGSKSAQAADGSKKTDFSEMSASFVVKDGVARNDDLKAASPFLRLSGAGQFDIGNSTIDYTAKATLAATSKGQGGAAAADVTGITVPVKLGGTFEAPTWSIDYAALLGALGGSAGKLGGAVGAAGSAVGGVVGGAAGSAAGAAGAAGNQVKDKLKGLFGR